MIGREESRMTAVYVSWAIGRMDSTSVDGVGGLGVETKLLLQKKKCQVQAAYEIIDLSMRLNDRTKQINENQRPRTESWDSVTLKSWRKGEAPT